MTHPAKHDLPDRFGPMLVKEMRQNLRRGSFVVPFLMVHVLAVAALVLEFQTGARDEFAELAGMMNVAMLWDSGPLWIVISLICCVIMPLAGLVLMGQELDEGNHELLLLTRLKRWSVVRGKFFSLWSISCLTLLSLVPYVLVRYQAGAVELPRELARGLTVLGLASLIGAGAIGASSFRTLAGRILVMILFLGSAMLGGGIAIAAAGARGSAGILWHINAVAAVWCFTVMGLSLARSRLRLVIHAYEVKPSFMVIGLLFFAPFVIGMTTAMTIGYGGFVGLIGMGLVSIYTDVTPKAPAWVKAPPPNIPAPPVDGDVQSG